MLKPRLRDWLLVLPALGAFLALLVAPLAMLLAESFRQYVGGRVGGQRDAPLTFAAYTDLMDPAYALYFADTFRIGLVTSVLAVVLALPLAYCIARTPRRTLRTLLLGGLLCMLFLSVIARVYAVLMTYGPTGPLKSLAFLLGMTPSSRRYAEVQVIIGLLHLVLPLAALTLVGTLQNLNPRLEEAAQLLGATRWQAAAGVTLPLAMPGILSAFLIAYAICISNFVVPLILGKGVVLFTSNLMYIRFSEIANYPSGAAIGVIMLVLSFVLILALTTFVRRFWPETAR
jgi:ABC-type spermidine/putrescine transport system permease subunit I